MASKLGFTTPKKLNEASTMPQMGQAFNGWKSTIALIETTQSFVDSERVVTEKRTNFQATVQPLEAEKIQLKPEGQRSWEWLQLHVLDSSLNLNTEDRVEILGVRYKIMGKYDYKRNNYVEYHCVKDFN